MRIQTIIATALRCEPYIHKTLVSLEESGYFGDGGPVPIRFVVGSLDASYLDVYRNNPGKYKIERINPGEPELALLNTLHGTQRCSFTHSLAMAERNIPQNIDAVLILEDDLRFSLGWWKRLVKISEDVVLNNRLNWVISLYAPFTTETKDAYETGKLWIRRSLKLYSFFGTQAVLYPKLIAIGFGLYLFEHSVKTFKRPIDHLLSEYLSNKDIPMFSTAPCLVQHIGRTSEGVSSTFHESRGFVEDVRPQVPNTPPEPESNHS